MNRFMDNQKLFCLQTTVLSSLPTFIGFYESPHSFHISYWFLFSPSEGFIEKTLEIGSICCCKRWNIYYLTKINSPNFSEPSPAVIKTYFLGKLSKWTPVIAASLQIRCCSKLYLDWLGSEFFCCVESHYYGLQNMAYGLWIQPVWFIQEIMVKQTII